MGLPAMESVEDRKDWTEQVRWAETDRDDFLVGVLDARDRLDDIIKELMDAGDGITQDELRNVRISITSLICQIQKTNAIARKTILAFVPVMLVTQGVV